MIGVWNSSNKSSWTVRTVVSCDVVLIVSVCPNEDPVIHPNEFCENRNSFNAPGVLRPALCARFA